MYLLFHINRFPLYSCGSLDEPHTPKYLNTWSLVDGTVWKGLECMTLLQYLCQGGQPLRFSKLMPYPSLCLLFEDQMESSEPFFPALCWTVSSRYSQTKLLKLSQPNKLFNLQLPQSYCYRGTILLQRNILLQTTKTEGGTRK